MKHRSTAPLTGPLTGPLNGPLNGPLTARFTAALVTAALFATALPAVAQTQAPASPRVPLHPDVTALLAEISPLRIEKTIRTLVGFGTRHTLSETESETRGTDAARRWIHRELQACSKAAGGRLQVAFDEHTVQPTARIPKAAQVVNVVATLPGTDPLAKERHFIVSGHYDSRASDVMDATSDAPGANDDASGTAAVMEMACLMARRNYPATLVFMTVAGEEQGLLGADGYAANARRSGQRIDAMITNDIIGSPVGDAGQKDARQVRLFADGLSPLLTMAMAPPTSNTDTAQQTAVREQLQNQVRTGGMSDFGANQLGRHLKEVGERYLPSFNITLIQRPDRFLRGGDHLPFLNRGFAAVRFTEPFENFMRQHQNVRVEGGVQVGDLLEFVDPAYIADVTRINAAGLALLAMAPATPTGLLIETLALGNETTLRWDAPTDPRVAGYRVLWRESASPVWQSHRDVGKLARVTLPDLSKDNLIFGVQALDAAGNASLAGYPLPLRR